MRGITALAPALLLAACATPTVVLLPGENGHPVGALAVLGKNGDDAVLDRPLASARMSSGGTSVHTLSQIPPAYQQVMDTLPPPAKSFTLYFITDTTTIVPTSQDVLDQIRTEVARRPGAEVQVTGHTDTTGDEDYDDRLSMQRAQEVVAFLVSKNFPREMLTPVGRGKREPKVKTGDGVANAENRRVEVIVR